MFGASDPSDANACDRFTDSAFIITSANGMTIEECGYPLTVGRICTLTGMFDVGLFLKNKSILCTHTPFGFLATSTKNVWASGSTHLIVEDESVCTLVTTSRTTQSAVTVSLVITGTLEDMIVFSLV